MVGQGGGAELGEDDEGGLGVAGRSGLFAVVCGG